VKKDGVRTQGKPFARDKNSGHVEKKQSAKEKVYLINRGKKLAASTSDFQPALEGSHR